MLAHLILCKTQGQAKLNVKSHFKVVIFILTLEITKFQEVNFKLVATKHY